MKISNQDKMQAKKANLTTNEFIAFNGFVRKSLEAVDYDLISFLHGESANVSVIMAIAATGLGRFNSKTDKEQWADLTEALVNKGLILVSSERGHFYLSGKGKDLYGTFISV
jgi:hypothetical protein